MATSPQLQDAQTDESEISLLDVYEFVRDAWRPIAAAALACALVSVGGYTPVPHKYEASATTDSARVLGNPVEAVAALA